VAYRPNGYILVTIRLTIVIRESVPDHDPDPGKTVTLSTHTEQMPSWRGRAWSRGQVIKFW